MAVSRIFGSESSYVADLGDIRYWSFYSESPTDKKRDFDAGMAKLTNLLNTAIEEVNTFGTDSQDGPVSMSPLSRKVFVVHGHDDALKQTVARVVTKLALEPVILHEKPNKSRTIIEKFEDYSDVSFAIVLLTPDDMGYDLRLGEKTVRPRARQNVILELGFFLGRLTRSRVVALFVPTDNFELPTDYTGVLFVPVDDAGKWQMDLVHELKASGIDVDANRLFD